MGSFVVLGVIGPWIAPHPPAQLDVSQSLLPPAWLGGGTTNHLLGTDQLGRDVLSRLLSGARLSLIVALVAVVLSGAVGVLLALIAGYLGGRADAVITRVTDASIAFPILLLAIVIVGIYGPSTTAVIVILTIAGWPQYCRVLRSEVLSLTTRDFVSMARVMGAPRRWVIGRHLLPNLASTILVLATLQMGGAIIAEGSLSFLGIGVPPPSVSWGGMLADGHAYLTTAWWLCTFPGVALSLTVLAANVLGDWLRVRNDPTRRR
ncbi:MAG: ABC transporter permease [Ilumatobacteraceae bacterium]